MNEYNLEIDRIIECRTKLGISKREMAKRIGISQPAYLRYESGERKPSIQVINEIARVLHTSPDYILGKSNSSDPLILEVSKEEQPELFEIVEIVSRDIPGQTKRVLEYVKKLKP